MVITYNLPQEYNGKSLTKIIIVMQIIESTTSPDNTAITSENIGAPIDKMDHELPTICSWLFNCLFIHIVRTYSFISPWHIQQGPINKNYLVSTKTTFLETLNITNNVCEHLNGVFGMVSYLMDTIDIILQKIIQILLWMVLSLGLLQ